MVEINPATAAAVLPAPDYADTAVTEELLEDLSRSGL